jgi:hypothetical protein
MLSNEGTGKNISSSDVFLFGCVRTIPRDWLHSVPFRPGIFQNPPPDPESIVSSLIRTLLCLHFAASLQFPLRSAMIIRYKRIPQSSRFRRRFKGITY